MTEAAWPPLVPLSDYPLHPSRPPRRRGRYGSSIVWACQAPERPEDENTAYDWRCRPCVLAAAGALEHEGDRTVQWATSQDGPTEPVLFSWLVARSFHWLELP